MGFVPAVEVSEDGAAEDGEDGALFGAFGFPEGVGGGVCAPGEDGEGVLELGGVHAFVAVPEEDHFFEGTDAYGVDEGDFELGSAGFPFLDLARDEDVEGELAGHEFLFAGVLRSGFEVFRCFASVCGC